MFLNACRTASATAQDMTWAVTEAFSSGGVPAVLGMQADIRGDAAAALSGPLYRALANGDPVDVALARARRRSPTRSGSTVATGACRSCR